MMHLVSIKYIKQREMTSWDLFCLKSPVLQKENTEKLFWNKKKVFFFFSLKTTRAVRISKKKTEKGGKDSMNSTNLKMFSNTLVW